MANPDLLIELGTEELPPKALGKLINAFRDEVLAGLADAGLAHGECRQFCTPRRVALLIGNVPQQQPDQAIERKGPAVAVAFDAQGKPSRAAEGFARSCGVAVAELEKLETDSGAWLVFRQEKPGAALAELLPAVVSSALAKLPIPKRMRWGAREDEFVRPVHWLVIMHGDTVVPAEVLGAGSANQTRGHRFHHPDALTIPTAASYPQLLSESGYVQPDFALRRELIRQQVTRIASDLGGQVLLDEGLLDEVTALVE